MKIWLILLALPAAAQVPFIGRVGAVKLGPPAGYRAAADTARSIRLAGFMSSWLQDCADGCGLPAGVVKNEAVGSELGLPDKPGEFRKASFTRTFVFPGLEKPLGVQTTVYAICPRGGTPTAEDPCPGRYFQVQTELSGAAGAVCGASLNERDVQPFPVMTCGAPAGTSKVGITLHRVPL
jgi:hypothetical protein